MRYQRAELPLLIDGLASAKEFFAGCLADSNPERESLFVAHLDGDSRCVHLSRHDGDESGAHFPLREIVADAAVHGSAGIVLAHNHPSGDPAPSASDMRSTRRRDRGDGLHRPRPSDLRRHRLLEPAPARLSLNGHRSVFPHGLIAPGAGRSRANW